jgi:hypothetical protein
LSPAIIGVPITCKYKTKIPKKLKTRPAPARSGIFELKGPISGLAHEGGEAGLKVILASHCWSITARSPVALFKAEKAANRAEI